MNIKKYDGCSVIVPAVISTLLAIVVSILINYATGAVFSIWAWVGLVCTAVLITFITIQQVILQQKTEHAMCMMQQETAFQSSLVTLFFCHPKENLPHHAATMLQERIREQLDTLDLGSRTRLFGILARSGLITNEIGQQFQGIELQDADLKQISLPNINLEGSILRGANLHEANLSYALLRKAELQQANLSQATLTGADLQYTNLEKCLLSGANLCGANLSYSHVSTHADLSGAILREALLRCAIFKHSNLSEADLTKADLSGKVEEVEFNPGDMIYQGPSSHSYTVKTDLTGAKLSRAILHSANLSYCDLRDADLTDAYLGQTLLDRADMRGVKITKQQISMAKSAKNIRWG